MSMMQTKNDVRAGIKTRLAALDNERFRLEGNLAATRLAGQAPWRATARILLFLSMRDEIDTAALLNTALTANKEVYAPRIEGDAMVFYRIAGADAWNSGAYGIREPAPGPRFRPQDGGALILTPGLAFDRYGNRLGRGKGYYDRFLSSLPARAASPVEKDFFVCAFCMDMQVVDRVPADEHDMRVDAICTGRRFLPVTQD
jgi:5-formyltetrahydrofolate cyclo-ligase